MKKLNLSSIKKELEIDARALNIPIGSTEVFIEQTLKTVAEKYKSQNIITEKDLKLAISKELAKYHKDLAYVYKNRDKII